MSEKSENDIPKAIVEECMKLGEVKYPRVKVLYRVAKDAEKDCVGDRWHDIQENKGPDKWEYLTNAADTSDYQVFSSISATIGINERELTYFGEDNDWIYIGVSDEQKGT